MAVVAEIGLVIDRFPVLITQHMPLNFARILASIGARQRPRREADRR